MDGQRDAQHAPEGSFEELTAFLANHAEIAAERSRTKLGGPLTVDNLNQYLVDTDCLRHETRIRFDGPGLEANQFAEPYLDEVDGKTVCTLYVDPRFESRPEALPYFVAYMAAVINYGQVVSPEVCERYGSELVGLTRDDFYKTLCDLVDSADEPKA